MLESNLEGTKAMVPPCRHIMCGHCFEGLYEQCQHPFQENQSPGVSSSTSPHHPEMAASAYASSAATACAPSAASACAPLSSSFTPSWSDTSAPIPVQPFVPVPNTPDSLPPPRSLARGMRPNGRLCNHPGIKPFTDWTKDGVREGNGCENPGCTTNVRMRLMTCQPCGMTFCTRCHQRNGQASRRRRRMEKAVLEEQAGVRPDGRAK